MTKFIELTNLLSGDPLIMNAAEISLVHLYDYNVYRETDGYDRFNPDRPAGAKPLRQEKVTRVHVSASCSRSGDQRYGYCVRESIDEVRAALAPVAKVASAKGKSKDAGRKRISS